MKELMSLILLLTLYSCAGTDVPTQSTQVNNYYGRIKWEAQGGPNLNSGYILTVDSLEYILVLTQDGATMQFHKSLKTK